MGLLKGKIGAGSVDPLLARYRLPVAIVVALLVLLVGGYFGYQWYDASRTEKQARQQETIASRFGSDVARAIGVALEPVDKAIKADSVGSLLAHGDAAALAAKARELGALSDNVLGIRIVQPGLDETDYDGFPPLGYAALELLRQSEQRGVAPGAEIHFKGEDSENIAVLRRVESGTGKLLGHVLIALKPSILKSTLARTQVPAGYAELQQPVGDDGKPLVLGANGDARFRIGLPKISLSVPGAAWKVAYWAESRQIRTGSVDKGLPLLPIGAGAALLMAGGALVMLRRRRGTDTGTQDKTGRRAAAPTDSVPDQPQVAEPELTKGGFSEPVVEEFHALSDSIFRAYDIRGVVDEELSANAVQLIGMAIGSEAESLGQKTIVVGRDGRNSSAELSEALIAGLRSAGRDVIDIGRVPTPLVYFATHYLETGSGVMVTGSHNPPEYNGLKIMLAGETLFGERIAALKTRVDAGDFFTGSGELQSTEVLSEYIRRVSEDIPVALGSALNVVIDCGNGVAGDVAPQLIRALGHSVTELYCEVDGSFPHHHPDPSQPENLKDLIQAVKDNSADIGFAFDGDGDRLGVVDGDGNVIYPDRQLMLFARDVLSRNEGAEIVFDVKCSSRLPRFIEALGGKPVMWKTGHSFIKSKLKETGAPLAGEMSGHIFFKERWYGFDDALYAAARMLEILMGFKKPPVEVFRQLPAGVATPELKVKLAEREHRAFMEKFERSGEFADGTVTTIDGVRVDYADGWGLVRPSNTTPCLVLRFEADNKEALNRIGGTFKKTILNIDPDLDLPF
ncbi:MAG TPA: phosphomannomutase/phosphoglucomutase [Gammaproteobacteria bacterium]